MAVCVQGPGLYEHDRTLQLLKAWIQPGLLPEPYLIAVLKALREALQHFFFAITGAYDIIEGELEKIFYSRTAHHARI
jgi:hypothetical protein